MPPSQRRARARSSTAGEPPQGSLGEWLRYIGVRLSERDWTPVWPPDAFAIGAALLHRTGSYVELANGVARLRTRAPNEREADALGRAWRKTLNDTLGGESGTQRFREACPEIVAWWKTIRQHEHEPLDSVLHNPDLVKAAAGLCAAGDAACAGLGISLDSDPFLVAAAALLIRNDYRSFCQFIQPNALSVLGKRHTPQRGCTIRSLSHHLSLHGPSEIRAYWWGPFAQGAADLDVVNLLLLPWPRTVDPEDFCVTTVSDGKPMPVPSGADHRYFDYAPRDPMPAPKLVEEVKKALVEARKHAAVIHGIVFPELALDEEQFAAVEQLAVSEGAMLVAGMRAPGEMPQMPQNLCAIQPLALTDLKARRRRSQPQKLDEARMVQLKHHRWCLDRNQVLQYELGGRLPASKDCWEHALIGNREINFVTIGSWLTFCVLICEDLARQDPAADVIRAVGPNVVFALLMDGPQLKQRWPARYASVLAEDPGSSVLTLTSLGMAKRSQPMTPVPEASRRKDTVIALWRDAIFGEREIGLEPQHDACVLSLACRTAAEYTIDGRCDRDGRYFPVFAGAFPLSIRQ